MTSKNYPQEWMQLARLAREEAELTLIDRFRVEPSRPDEMSVMCGDLRVDFSRQHVSHSVLDTLTDLAHVSDVGENIEDMFNGAVMNITENRAAAHVLLRSLGDSPRERSAREQRARAAALAEGIRRGTIVGATGVPFTDVVSIGIGGSDLGNVLLHDALAFRADGPSVHFVSNIDPQHFDEIVLHGGLDPRSTLFVVASKTFTTAETTHIATRAREYLKSAVGDSWTSHMVATTASPATAREWGIPADRILEFWDWVGGRFSVSSVVAFPVMLAVGGDAFEEFISGMRTIDNHFRSAPLEANAPALHGMLGVWNSSIKNFASWAIVPYAHGLRRLPAYLQQLVMESNGKSVTTTGNAVSEPTSPVVWGESGTNAQHSFFQLLHQGTSKVPVDFIGFARGHSDDERGHHELVANMIAQSSALAFGRGASDTRDAGVAEQLVPHRTFEGNRPSTVVLAPRLTPSTLGQLIAFYEHSTVVQGWLWRINSFDQWGVELGKQVAESVIVSMETGDMHSLDPGAKSLVEWHNGLKG